MADEDVRVDDAPKAKERGGYERLVVAVARELDMPAAHVRRVLDHYHEVLRDEVWQRGRVSVPKVAVYQVRRRKARRVRMEHEGEVAVFDIPEHDAVVVRATRNWRVK